LGPKGGTLRLAADADLELGECEILGSGRWVIQAEQGPGRPRIRFQPAASDSRRATGWPVLFRVRSGALHLQGIDLVLEQAQAPNGGRWAAFGTYAGTELSLTDCTVTVAGRHPRSAVQAVLPGERDPEPGGAAADPSAASVRVTDCLLRSGGDLIDVAGGRRLDLEITNSVVATEGSLVHGHGSPRVPTADSVKIVLRQVTALDAGGLVHLESAVGEPELPLADVVARDSIFVTAPQGVPLFRVDGQDGIDANRDRVRWEGHGVAYHQISTYRRDQTTQLGTLPVSYDRPSWEVAVAPRDEAPVHGDLKFATEPDPDRSPWSLTAEDIRLAPDSPAHSAGPDLQRIPTPARIPRSPE
jgi:serine/threonine-protein kinase